MAAEKTYKEALLDLIEEQKKDDDCLPWIRFRVFDHQLEDEIDETLQKNLFLDIASL